MGWAGLGWGGGWASLCPRYWGSATYSSKSGSGRGRRSPRGSALPGDRSGQPWREEEDRKGLEWSIGGPGPAQRCPGGAEEEGCPAPPACSVSESCTDVCEREAPVSADPVRACERMRP